MPKLNDREMEAVRQVSMIVKKVESFRRSMNDDDPRRTAWKDNPTVIVDSEHISMVVIKNPILADIMNTLYIDVARPNPKVPDLRLVPGENAYRSVFSIDKLRDIIHMMDTMGDDHITLTIGDEYPLIADSNTYRFLLAPRLEDPEKVKGERTVQMGEPTGTVNALRIRNIVFHPEDGDIILHAETDTGHWMDFTSEQLTEMMVDYLIKRRMSWHDSGTKDISE